MCKGFMRISREIVDWGWYKDSNTFRVFFHLLINAQYKESTFMGHQIQRGQIVTGRKELAKEINLSEQNIRTALNHLKSTNEITIESTNKFSIITICRFDFWQGCSNQNNQQNNQQPNQPLTSNQPATNQQLTTYNKDKKDKNIDKKEDTNVSKKESDFEMLFDAFRKKYKSYGGKTRGLQVELENLKKKHKDWREIIPMLDYALERENEEREKAIRCGVFFPVMKNLQTYINQRSWEMYSEGFENYDPNEYHPNGYYVRYMDDKDYYLYIGSYPDAFFDDGYKDDERPDGAVLVLNNMRGTLTWKAESKNWELIK